MTKIREILEKHNKVFETKKSLFDRMKGSDDNTYIKCKLTNRTLNLIEKELQEYMNKNYHKIYASHDVEEFYKDDAKGTVKFTTPSIDSIALRKAVELLYPEKPISKSEWDKTNVLFTNLESLKKSRKKWFNRKKKDDNFIDKWFKNNARNTKKK